MFSGALARSSQRHRADRHDRRPRVDPIRGDAMNKFSRRIAAVAGALAVAASVAVAAECLRAIVTESDVTRQAENTPPTNNWVIYTRLTTSLGAFVLGPGNPPQGVGSLEFQTPTTLDKITIFNYDHAGTLLSAIDSMGYATYRDPTSVTTNPSQVPSINIQVDSNGGDALTGFTTLVFEPVYNTGQGAV